MLGHYILNEDREPVEVDMMTWALWFEKANRTVAKTVIVPNKVEVSTVFLGLDHNFNSQLPPIGCEPDPPIVFETLVFGGSMDGHMNRYATWDEAEAGHARMITQVKAAIAGSNVVKLPRRKRAGGKR
jgi:hypothetical protein